MDLGVTASVCKLIKSGITPEELTLDWQIENNSGYKDLLDFCISRDIQYSVDYNLVIETIKSANLNNGLSKEENERLFTTPYIDEVLNLVFKGLKSIFGNKNAKSNR